MITNISKFLTISFLLCLSHTQGQEIWKESFSVPGKGIWGNGEEIISSDFTGINNWTLEYSSLELVNSDDYARTVSTSGGRFEVQDINGEVIWRSKDIDISAFEKVEIQLAASETGSGANTATKYLQAFYSIDHGEEILFSTNGDNRGNWGKVIALQENLRGISLQIVVCISNHYANDKVILDEVTVQARLPYEEPLPGDLVINEILSDPVPGGTDYVEIFNKSIKLISAGKLYLASRDNDKQLTQVYQTSLTDYPLYPDEYLVLTKDTNGVFPWFNTPCPGCFLQMPDFPSFNNDHDWVVLLNEELEIIDELEYHAEMHSPFLYDTEGVSLERVNPEIPADKMDNWFSASSEAGYGTPGYQNSQFSSSLITGPLISFDPDAISPNLDGYNDEYYIHYKLDNPGYIANIWIFDAAGHLVLQLAKNILLGSNGDISWNGKNETGSLMPCGIYVVVMEIFNSAGKIYRYKDGVVLTSPGE